LKSNADLSQRKSAIAPDSNVTGLAPAGNGDAHKSQLGAAADDPSGYSNGTAASLKRRKSESDDERRGDGWTAASMTEVGTKWLHVARSFADLTGFEGAAPVGGDGAMGEVMYERFRKFDDKYLQPFFGRGEVGDVTDTDISDVFPAERGHQIDSNVRNEHP
jgi:hypothetical protein